jgi:hypothetical protein
MKNPKSLIAAIIFASASFASTSVLADISSPAESLALMDNSAFFGDTFAMNNMDQTFADRFTFSITDPVPQTFDAIVSSIGRTAGTGLDITGLALYDSSNALLTSGTSMSGGRIDVWTLSNTNLPTGDYYLQVRGNMVSNGGASFGGAVMLAPVPEPETYGMMLGGLGLLGFLARRRGKQTGVTGAAGRTA